jgi:hypothetical protein
MEDLSKEVVFVSERDKLVQDKETLKEKIL